MNTALAIGALLILAISYIMWPKDDRSLKLVLTTTGIIASIIGFGIVIARTVPVTRHENVIRHVTIKRVKPPEVVYKDRTITVFKTPGHEFDPVDPAKVCTGSRPVEILVIDVVTRKENDATTWVITRPVGSQVKVTCYLDGNLDNFWKVGDIVQFTNGKPQ